MMCNRAELVGRSGTLCAHEGSPLVCRRWVEVPASLYIWRLCHHSNYQSHHKAHPEEVQKRSHCTADCCNTIRDIVLYSFLKTVFDGKHRVTWLQIFPHGISSCIVAVSGNSYACKCVVSMDFGSWSLDLGFWRKQDLRLKRLHRRLWRAPSKNDYLCLCVQADAKTLESERGFSGSMVLELPTCLHVKSCRARLLGIGTHFKIVRCGVSFNWKDLTTSSWGIFKLLTHEQTDASARTYIYICIHVTTIHIHAYRYAYIYIYLYTRRHIQNKIGKKGWNCNMPVSCCK